MSKLREHWCVSKIRRRPAWLEAEQTSVLGSIGVVAVVPGMVFAAMSSSSNYF